MCIEFDGICKGYNKGDKYIQEEPDGLRKLKMELKLRIAKEHDFPFYVVSYDESDQISEEIRLTVLDGIIGQTLVHTNLLNKISELDNNNTDIMNESDYKEYVEDLLLQAEVQLEFEHDPIVQKTGEMHELLLNAGINSCYTIRHFWIPELPTLSLEFNKIDKESVDKFIDAWNKVQWHGCEVFNENGVKGTARVRNFEGHASPLVVVENIAKLLFFHKLTRDLIKKNKGYQKLL
jgi:hypothetical protein